MYKAIMTELSIFLFASIISADNDRLEELEDKDRYIKIFENPGE